MKGIRLTPFLLFVILLVVLVIAMIFGYRSNRVLENMESDSGLWSVTQNASVATYDSGTALNTILAPSSSDIPGYYFDPKTANIIATNNVENPSFTLITRDSSGTPTIVTSQYSSNSPGAEDTNTITSMATPWTYNANNISLIYCPYQTNTFVVLIDNSSGNILTTFKNTNNSSYILATSNLQGGAQAGIDSDADLTLYSRLGVPTKDTITMNGVNVNVQKIQENVYFSSEKGVIVGESGDFNDQSVSTDYKKGVSKQNNGTTNSPSTILVLSLMIDDTHVLVAIIVKVDNKYQVASSNIISQSLTESKNGGSDDAFSITLKTSGGDSGTTTRGGSSGSSGTGSSGTNGSSSDESCSKDSSSSASKANEDVKHACASKSSSEASKDPEYIRKTEIVPPVCPACPTTNCPISVNEQGEIVDCTGKKLDLGQLAGVQGANGYSSAPASYGGAIGETATALGDTVQTGLKEVGDTAQTGLKEVGDTLQSVAPVASDAINTVGDVAEKGLDTAGGALDSAIGGAENIVGQVGSGLGSLGKGVADTVTGVSSDVTGLAKDVVGETGDLIGGAGTGLKELAEGNQDLQSQQMRQDFVQEMSQQQQGQMGQQQQGQMGQQQGQMGQQQGQMGYGYGYGQQQMGYNYGQPQQCNYCPQPGQGYSYPRACSSNFMPITNDFSQFT
jgi:hypothetical protein